ncbi:MAG: hypothetical protein E6J78_10520 [Deltaproteobacteria bacterium]|nr:MAG: hypothetical protein E6J78_10520 [Deltaproteobacteria bacterium]
MFWKMIALMTAVWAAAWFGSFTLGGLIHLLPVAAAWLVVMHLIAKPPKTEFGRWRPHAERYPRK